MTGNLDIIFRMHDYLNSAKKIWLAIFEKNYMLK